MKWIERLKEKWEVKSVHQFWIIMLVFACTGMTVVLVKRPTIAFLFPDGIQPIWFRIGYWFMIFPIYNCLLLVYAFIFGQFTFFWKYEKKMLGRFRKKTNVQSGTGS